MATHATTDYRVGRLPSGPVEVTVHRYEGGPGPTVYVQAAQHGIELNGPAALRRLHDDLCSADLAGTVVVVPVANPLALDHRTYLTPQAYDARHPNLNRVWPGDPSGSLGQRIAARLWELVAPADAVVDLHTGTPDMLEHARYLAGDDEARRLATTFGTDYVLADEDRDDTDGNGGSTLRAAAASAGIAAVTAELANSRSVDRAAAETGARGVRNVLRALDVLDAPAPDGPAPTLLRDDAEHTRAEESGLFEPAPELAVGEAVEAGEPLGTVYCPTSFAARQSVAAAAGGVVYSLTRGGLVMAGERLAGVATPV
ncbi:MAG: succinylglutamate desuccinylase/aspartoacylase family protein [Haloferacaceae archaeon]